MLEAYLDESGTHKNSPVMCIAGYILDPDQRIRLDEAFVVLLNEHYLEFFHMGDCAHGAKAFKDISKVQRIAIARRLIETIKLRIRVGIVFAFAEEDYKAVVPQNIENSWVARTRSAHRLFFKQLGTGPSLSSMKARLPISSKAAMRISQKQIASCTTS